MLTAMQKRKVGKVIHARWFVLLVGALAVFLCVAAWRASAAMFRAEARYDEVMQKRDALVEREAHVQGMLDELEDPRGVEAALRERYEVAKEGEVVLVLSDNEEVEENESEQQEKGLWEKMLDFLF